MRTARAIERRGSSVTLGKVKTSIFVLLVCAISSSAFGQSPFVVLDKSETNRKAVAQYDREVRRRIDFGVLRSAVSEFIAARKTVSVGGESDRYTVDLQPHRLKGDWHLLDPYEKVYGSGRWCWGEDGDKVIVWFSDYSVRITLTFQFTERRKCLKIAEDIEDTRYVIE